MTKTLVRSFFVALLFLLTAPAARAYPGMIRNGYVNCTACHVSPSGGGVLTPYGRGLSAELLSTWGKEGEGAFLYGAFAKKLPEALLLGGDARIMDSYRSNPQFTEKRLFLMQADVEAAYQIGKFTVDAEVGYLDTNDVQSLRHYVMYHFDDENTLRLGKFRQNYGINLEEHTASVKGKLGFGDETETYNLEYAHLTDAYNVFVTAMAGAPESVENRDGLSIGSVGAVDRGASVRVSKFFADKFEVGASYFYGQKKGAPWRTTTGPFVILGFNPRFYYLGELDFQNLNGWRLFDYQRLTYEVIQGLQLFVTQEYGQGGKGGRPAKTERYGTGVQFFPRPHFAFDFRWHWQKDTYSPSSFRPMAWLLLHLYL